MPSHPTWGAHFPTQGGCKYTSPWALIDLISISDKRPEFGSGVADLHTSYMHPCRQHLSKTSERVAYLKLGPDCSGFISIYIPRVRNLQLMSFIRQCHGAAIFVQVYSFRRGNVHSTFMSYMLAMDSRDGETAISRSNPNSGAIT